MMIINKAVKLQSILILLFFLLLILQSSLASKVQYPEWKIKLSYMLLSKGKQVLSDNPHLAIQYFKRAKKIYPQNIEAEELIKEVASKVDNPSLLPKQRRKKIKILASDINSESNYTQFSQQDENSDIPRAPEKHPPKIYPQKQKSSVSEETYSFQDKNVIIAEYKGISEDEEYKAWKRGPTINTVLDIYHPQHPGKTFPYYKNYEGFKLNPYFGVWANYEVEKAPVGMETLIENAKEFSRYSDEQLREYVSTNDKEFWDWELRYYYKDYWPKITYIYHTADTRRAYPGKLVWSSNSIWSENEDYHELKLDYTFRNLKYIGYLRVEPFIRFTKWTSDNDSTYLGKEKRYEMKVSCMPMDGLELILEYTYLKNKKSNHPNIGGEIMESIKKKRYYIELIKHIPEKRFKISFSYLSQPEKWIPTDEEWPKQEVKLYWEKNLTSKLKFRQDLEYLYLERNKQPHLSSHLHDTAEYLKCKNKISKEVIKDLTCSLEYEYATGVEFKGFDYHNIDAELELFKPGLIRLKLGTGYTYYYNIDDHLWSLYFKFSESAPFIPMYILRTKWGDNELKLGIGAQYIDNEFKSRDGSTKSTFERWNQIFTLSEEIRWNKLFLGARLKVPLNLGKSTGKKKINGVTVYTYPGMQYDWKEANLYCGWKFWNMFRPYLGICWSKEKIHWSDTEFLGLSLGTGGTSTHKAWLYTLGIKGDTGGDRLSLVYGVRYSSSFDTEIQLGSNQYHPDAYFWSANLGLNYRVGSNLALFLDANCGKIHWDYVGDELMEENTKYLELITGVKWLF